METEKIQTGALNHLNYMINLYYSPKEKILSDESHAFYEATLHDCANYQKIEKLAKLCCERFFCKFNRGNNEFYCHINAEEGKQNSINRLIQAITMFEILVYQKGY